MSRSHPDHDSNPGQDGNPSVRRGSEPTMNGNHLKYMLLAGAGVFGVLLLIGLPPASALLYAVLLACPLMMFTMGGHGAGHDHTPLRSNEPGESTDPASQHRPHL